MALRSFAFVLLALGLAPLAFGQGASDAVRFRNPKKDFQEERVQGQVQETAGGVKVLANGKTVAEVAAGNIIAVEYGTLPGLDKVSLDLRSADNGTDAAKARDLFTAEANKNPADPKTKKFLDYRAAVWTARAADEKTGPAFEKEAPAAVAKLTAFAQEYGKKKAWEVWPVARTAARIQAELGKYPEAAAAYSLLSKADGLPADLKLEARLGEAEMFLRAGNALTTASAVDELAKTPNIPAGTLRERLTILQAAAKAAGDKRAKEKPAAAVKAIEDVITKTTDPTVRAAGHNALGELYLQADLPRDAMWEFLRVEVVDNQDRDQVVQAVIRLAECFQKQNDEARAKLYRDKLPQVKGA